uniref:Testis expressed 264, ER-phagy receptor n=1 Tax=Amazona collaria TaxID=241587 RepID=A0A8B9GIN0_9PSIT
MSDWVLLGLIAVLVMLLLLTVFGFAVYSGLFTEVVVSAGSPPVGSITLAYKFRVGPYGESGQLFTDGCSISSKLYSIGVYYDNPHTVSPEKCRFAIGRILSEGDAKPSEEQIKRFQKYGFKIFSFPAPSHVVMATFPFTTPLSIHLAINRVHPALDTYIKERKLCAHPRIEIYKEDRIYFVCPLARQGDFYVPEMKELERKSRAAAAEAEDAQTDITGSTLLQSEGEVGWLHCLWESRAGGGSTGWPALCCTPEGRATLDLGAGLASGARTGLRKWDAGLDSSLLVDQVRCLEQDGEAGARAAGNLCAQMRAEPVLIHKAPSNEALVALLEPHHHPWPGWVAVLEPALSCVEDSEAAEMGTFAS